MLSLSAFQDRRFEPIAAREVPSLRCSVSLLVCYETAAHAFDWVVGTHGILIKFQDKKGKHYSATYLPEVASEQGWACLWEQGSVSRWEQGSVCLWEQE